MLKALLLLLVAMVSIQVGATLAKNIFPIMGAAGTSAMRLFFATIILWCIFRPWRIKFTSEQLKKLFIYGASLGLMNLTFYYALTRIPLGITVALEFIGPLTVAIFTSKRKADYLWAILAGIGIYLLMPVSGATRLDPIGVGFALTAGFFWGLYIIYGQKAGRDIEGGIAAAMGMLVAALVVIPFGVYSAGTKLFDYSLWPYGIGVAILSSALPYSLEMISLKRLPTRTFGVLMSLEPAIAAFAGLIFLREELTPVQIFAIVCVIISSLGTTLTVNKKLTPA